MTIAPPPPPSIPRRQMAEITRVTSGCVHVTIVVSRVHMIYAQIRFRSPLRAAFSFSDTLLCGQYAVCAYCMLLIV